MKPEPPLPPVDAKREISALIASLLLTEQRLRRAQNHMRQTDAARQAAILDALPAHIALLDHQGCVISVNATWQRFSSDSALRAPVYGIGLNYLAICDAARGDEASQAR
jgi:transcriptional regulator with PAS, ATPase and Fis domain